MNNLQSLQKMRVLNMNTLKFLAAAFMVIDHIGVIFFPFTMWWRIIGRLSMPLFAFAISEGCRYTRNKVKHFALLFVLATLCQIVYYLYDGTLYLCILVTFSLSILNIYALQNLKKKFFEDKKITQLIPAMLLFLLSVAFTALVCNLPDVMIDYGFWGCMMPVLASLFDFRNIPVPENLQKLDCLPVRVGCMSIAVLFVAIELAPTTPIGYFALLTIPLLLLYNGKKGKCNTKYFFYIFYPLHLVLLQGIAYLIYFL